MTSLLIISETGDSYPIKTVDEFKLIAESHISKLELTKNDINIFSGKNLDLLQLNKISEIEKNCKYYVFSRKFSEKTGENFKEQLANFIKEVITSSQNDFINAPDVEECLKVIEGARERLSFNVGDIRETAENLGKYYSDFKEINKKLKIHIKTAEFIKENFSVQIDSSEFLMKIIESKLNNCSKNCDEFIKESKELKEISCKIIKEYSYNMDKLKGTEINKDIKEYLFNKTKQNKTNLIDIYFNEADVNKWRDNCVEVENAFYKKGQEKNNLFLSEKNRINNELNAFLTQIKNDVKFYEGEYSNILNEKVSKNNAMINELSNDYENFNLKLQNIKEIIESNLMDSNPNYLSNLKDYYKSIIELKEKYSDTSKLSGLLFYLQPFFDFVSKMKNYVVNVSKKVNEFYMSVKTAKNTIEKLSEKFISYNSGLRNVKSDFKYLEAPGFFLRSYQSAVEELKRRVEFDFKIKKEMLLIEALITRENNARNEFVGNNKKFLTKEFLKLFSLESKVTFSYELSDEKEYKELIKIYDNNSKNNYNNDNKTPSLFVESTADLKDCLLIKDLIAVNQELENKTKHLSEELDESKRKNEHCHKKISQLNEEFKQISVEFDEILDCFDKEFKVWNKRCKELREEIENMKKNLSEGSDGKGKCPLCVERIKSSPDHPTLESTIQSLQSASISQKRTISSLQSNFHVLLKQTSFIKKAFLTHFTSLLEAKNCEMMSFRSTYERKFMAMEEALANEKIYNRKEIAEKMGKLEGVIEELRGKIKGKEVEIEEWKGKWDELKGENEGLKGKMREGEKERKEMTVELEEGREERGRMEEELKELKDLLEKKKKEHIITVQNITSQNNKNIENLNNRLNELSKKLLEDTKEYDNIKLINENLLLEKNDLNKEIEKLSYMVNEYKLKEVNPPLNSVISYKSTKPGQTCLFVPFSENVFVCLNLNDELQDDSVRNFSQPNVSPSAYSNNNLPEQNDDSLSDGTSLFFNCKYILDLGCLDEELRKVVVENSLIVVGKVGKITEVNNEEYGLPEEKVYASVELESVEYVVGFPEDEIAFKVYNS